MWCRRRDSNPQSVKNMVLSHARIPIPPRRPAPLRYRIRQRLSMCYSVSMKHLSLVLGILLSVGCQLQPLTVNTTTDTEVQTYWLNYYPTQCNTTPWGDTLAETTITDYYQNLAVTIAAIEVNAPPSGFFSCSACGCSTGVQVSIQTDEAGKAILLEHGFTEEELVGIAESGITENAEKIAEDTEATLEDAETGITENSEGIPEATEETTTETTGTTIEVELSAEDAALQTRAELVQSALTDYYSQHGVYPDSLTDLTVQLDATGMTYTPIGVTPADYYDLSVEYSTGKTLLNP